MSISVAIVRVFTTADGRLGNALGIVDADSVPAEHRQQLAAQLGFSETIVVTRPAAGTVTASAADTVTASARIFTPAGELPFAGHPTVGLAWWLREGGTPIDALAVPAGNVAVRYAGELTWVRARADWAPQFTMHQLASPDAVTATDPDSFQHGLHYAWAWQDEGAGAIRSRMFAPLMGIAEDEATGAAAVRITAQLQRDLTITQGQGSRLRTVWNADGWIEVGGRVRPEATMAVSLQT